MWRVVNQYMATYNGPTPPNMEVPVSPITGTVFKNAAATKMVHIAEFTADLIKHNKLNLRPERNNHIITTWHDSCNPGPRHGSSGRAPLHPEARLQQLRGNARAHHP